MRALFSPVRLGLLPLLFVALALLAYAQATSSYKQQLREYVERNVLQKVDSPELYSFNDPVTQQFLAQEMNRDLAELCGAGGWQPLMDCSAQVFSFQGLAFAVAPGASQIMDFYQPPQSPKPLLQVAVFYRMSWSFLLLVPGGLALLAWLALALLPAPVAADRLLWIGELKRLGLTQAHALALTQAMPVLPSAGVAHLGELMRLCQQDNPDLAERLSLAQILALAADARVIALSEAQLPWLLKGLEYYPDQLDLDLDPALAGANAPEQLQFFPESKTLSIHGLQLSIADTPFFYYYWYALLRHASDDGWYANPAQTRPDMLSSQGLQALLEKYGGHAKAASELRDKGLRAKTLDQNRSKIKDELVRHLGEALAQPYLFDQQRDLRTARFNYRISLAPAAIQLPAEDLDLLRNVLNTAQSMDSAG